MNTLKDLTKIQKEFDESHTGKNPWYTIPTDDSPAPLGYTALCLAGETGELANIIKKIIRGEFTIIESRKKIAEELADIFAYTLKISYQMDIDLEDAYIQKMKKNRIRFKKYETK